MFEDLNLSGLLDTTAAQRLKIAIVGEQKTGKSWLALTKGGSMFVADFDGRVESVKEFIKVHKRNDILVKSYIDKNPTMPNAVLDLETDIGLFEYAKSQGKAIPETFVLDSMTFLKSACERELMRQEPSLSRTIRFGSNRLRIPQGWDVINGNRQYLEYLIGRLSELGNLICVFHEQDEKDVATSTKEEKRYTGRKTIQPQYLSTLLSTFNDVFRISIDYSGKRMVTVKPSQDFLASTSMAALAETEDPNIQAMIEKNNTIK